MAAPFNHPVPPIPPPPEAAAIRPSRPHQFAAIALLIVIAVLIGWRWCSDRYGTRPTERQPFAEHRIDLNRATRSELVQIPGVGTQLADRIVLHRETHGKFGRVEDLSNIHGIGDATLNKIRPFVAIQPADAVEPLPEPDRLTRKPAAPTRSISKYAPSAEKIDVNTATLEQLDSLPNIGPVIAQRIIVERQKRPFASVDDLRRVSGIGAKRLDGLRDLVTVGD